MSARRQANTLVGIYQATATALCFFAPLAPAPPSPRWGDWTFYPLKTGVSPFAPKALVEHKGRVF